VPDDVRYAVVSNDTARSEEAREDPFLWIT